MMTAINGCKFSLITSVFLGLFNQVFAAYPLESLPDEALLRSAIANSCEPEFQSCIEALNSTFDQLPTKPSSVSKNHEPAIVGAFIDQISLNPLYAFPETIIALKFCQAELEHCAAFNDLVSAIDPAVDQIRSRVVAYDPKRNPEDQSETVKRAMEEVQKTGSFTLFGKQTNLNVLRTATFEMSPQINSNQESPNPSIRRLETILGHFYPSFPSIPEESPVIRALTSEYDPSQVGKRDLPIEIGEVIDTKTYDHHNKLRVLDMTVKVPGSNYVFPTALSQFREVFQKMINFEHAHNPEAANQFCYATVDSSELVTGQQQRQGPPHTDGFQGVATQPGLGTDHIYLVVNGAPTQFFDQEFDMRGVDPRKHNLYESFEVQVKSESIVLGKPYIIYAMSPYTIHQGGVADQPIYRNFVRLICTKRVYDRASNTITIGLPGYPSLPNFGVYSTRAIPPFLEPFGGGVKQRAADVYHQSMKEEEEKKIRYKQMMQTH